MTTDELRAKALRAVTDELYYSGEIPEGHVWHKVVSVAVSAILSELDARVRAATRDEARYRAAIEGLLAAMDMQVKRERGEFHIPVETARTIWNDAVNAATLALRPRLSGTVLMDARGEHRETEGE